MTFIPSIRLSENLEIASTGIWPEEVQDGRAVIVCKIPETAIKALHLGAKSSLFLSIVRAESLDILCLALRVFDEPEHPFTVLMPNVTPEDPPLLQKILLADVTALHCLNELNHPMLSAWCHMDRKAATEAAEKLRASNHWLLTPEFAAQHETSTLGRFLELSVDYAQREVYRAASAVVPAETRMAVHLPLELKIWPAREVFEVTPTAADGPFLIADGDEGSKLERLIHLALDQAYPGSSFVSPQVQDGQTRRELTDVLAFDHKTICVVQAKALSVLNVNRDRPSSRRAASVTKDIKKAIGQLVGAINNIRSAAPIYTADGELMIVPKRTNSLVNAIVVVSEMYSLVDWKRVAADLQAESENESRRALFHVMDLQELSALTSRCPDSWTFFERLCARWLQVKIKGTSQMRTKVMSDIGHFIRPRTSLSALVSWHINRGARRQRSSGRLFMRNAIIASAAATFSACPDTDVAFFGDEEVARTTVRTDP